MRFPMIIVGCLIVCACSKGEAEEKRYEIVRQSAVVDRESQLCEQARKVSAGYLEDGNQEQYQFWQVKLISDCK